MLGAVLLFLNIGGSEMIFIFIVALFLFGGDKLPEIARGLGKGIRDFKDASEGVKREINNQIYNYEEKKAEDAYVSSAQAAEASKELSPSNENADATHPDGSDPDAYNPVNGPIGVPNTIQYIEHNNNVAGAVTEGDKQDADIASETQPEPTKTTHV